MQSLGQYIKISLSYDFENRVGDMKEIHHGFISPDRYEYTSVTFSEVDNKISKIPLSIELSFPNPSKFTPYLVAIGMPYSYAKQKDKRMIEGSGISYSHTTKSSAWGIGGETGTYYSLTSKLKLTIGYKIEMMYYTITDSEWTVNETIHLFNTGVFYNF